MASMIMASVTENDIKVKGKEKAKKVPKIRSCDFCRNNKIRCDRLPNQCTNCAKRGIECTRNNPYQKRGPKPKKGNNSNENNSSNNNDNHMEINTNHTMYYNNVNNTQSSYNQIVSPIVYSNHNQSNDNSSYYKEYYPYHTVNSNAHSNNMFNINLESISSPSSYDLTHDYYNSPSLDSNGFATSPGLPNGLLVQLGESENQGIHYFMNNINPCLNIISQEIFFNQLYLNQNEIHLINLIGAMCKLSQWHLHQGSLKANQILFQFQVNINILNYYDGLPLDPNLACIIAAIRILEDILRMVNMI